MEETTKPYSTWQHFLDFMPKTFDEFPLFYTEEEMGWLEGSPQRSEYQLQKNQLKHDYNLICVDMPEFCEMFSADQF